MKLTGEVGLFQWRRGCPGRGVREEQGRGNGGQVRMGRGQASGQHSGPLMPGSPGERKFGQERRFRLPGTLSLGAPDRTKPSISWCKSPPDRRSPCLFLFKERGRPISLPGAYVFCFLIFQSSDCTAFYHSVSSSQQEEPFPLLLDPRLGRNWGQLL